MQNNFLNPLPSLHTHNIPLERYPITRAFMIEAAIRIKGESATFWDQALRGYKVWGRCACMKCLSFYLTSPEGDGPFDRGYVSDVFGETMVIFREDKQCRLQDFELPFVTNVPFIDEYHNFGRSDYISMISSVRAREIVKEWFTKNTKRDSIVIIVD